MDVLRYTLDIFMFCAMVKSICSQDDTEYIGCFEDRSSRFLKSVSTVDKQMTVSKCIQFCSRKSYVYAGVEYREQCFCGKHLGSYQKKSDTECKLPCGGNTIEKCGGTWRISVYKVSANYITTVQKKLNGVYIGCFEDRSSRFLKSAHTVDKQMTVSKCIQFCLGKSYVYAGVEVCDNEDASLSIYRFHFETITNTCQHFIWQYREQCFCGKHLGSYQKKSDTECKLPCGGNAIEKCGGTWRISVYKANRDKDGTC